MKNLNIYCVSLFKLIYNVCIVFIKILSSYSEVQKQTIIFI